MVEAQIRFQQKSVFRKWWVEAERQQELGFSARVCVSFCSRAVVTREHGRRTEAPLVTLVQRIWRHLAQHYGHHLQQAPGPYHLSVRGEAAFQEAYHSIADIEAAGGFGSAVESLLGKFEYWASCIAGMTELQSRAWRSEVLPANGDIDERALKCALRFFDVRLALGCAVVDHEVTLAATRQTQTARRPVAMGVGEGQHAAVSEADAWLGTLLRRCVEEPVTYSSLSVHFSHMRQDRGAQRHEAMVQLERAGFGRLVPATVRVPDLATPAVALYRWQRDARIDDELRRLGVPLANFRPSPAAPSRGSDRNPAPQEVPEMHGAGQFCSCQEALV